jgi:hypothetical protein
MGAGPPPVSTLPTATQSVADEHDTPDNEASVPPVGTGAVEGVHERPARVSTSGKYE